MTFYIGLARQAEHNGASLVWRRCLANKIARNVEAPVRSGDRSTIVPSRTSAWCRRGPEYGSSRRSFTSSSSSAFPPPPEPGHSFEASTTEAHTSTTSPAEEAGNLPETEVGRDGDDADGSRREAEYEDPRLGILDAALNNVDQHGFSTTALAAGAKDCGFHSVATGMFPHGAADLVHHVLAKALSEVKKLNEEYDSPDTASFERRGGYDDDETSAVGRLRSGIRASISTVAPYRKHWHQAMSIGASPQNAGNTATALAVLADELAFLSGDRSTDLAWYSKRGIIAGINASTELFMLTDESEDLADTWNFLDRRLQDYETLTSSPENAKDIATGVTTVAASLSSAAVSLAGPFLKQASKQVPGGETLAQAAPSAAALASQALSFVASRVPGGQASAWNSSSDNDASRTTYAAAAGGPPGQSHAEEVVTYPGAPESDPYLEKPVSHTEPAGATIGGGAGPGKLEDQLAEGERELFGPTESGKPQI